MLNFKSILFFFFLGLIFSSSLLAGIDESRKIVSKPSGEKEFFSELRRPGTAHLDWRGFNLALFEDEIKGSQAQEDDYLSIYGAMEQKWHREVLGAQVKGAINPYPLPPERWSHIKLYNYDHNLIYYGPISRHAEDPYWRLGTFLEWIQLEPGPSKIRSLADNSRSHFPWNYGLPDWQKQQMDSRARPIENITHSSLF